MLQREKSREISQVRWLIAKIAVDEAGYRLVEVARFLSRDPGVMSRGLRQLEERLQKDRNLQKSIGRIQARVCEGRKPKIAKRHAPVCVYQDARDHKTKFSKTFTTFFFPVGEEIQQIVADWVNYLRQVKFWGNDDPLFPATHMVLNAARQFEATGLKREHWSSAAPIRGIFREAFHTAGLLYFNPHSFRNTLVRFAETLCQTPEEFKAWSQNLGHEDVLTTFRSYGAVGTRRQSEFIRDLAKPQQTQRPDAAEFAKAVARELRSAKVIE